MTYASRYWLVENDPWDDYVPTKEMIMASNAFNVRRLLKYGLCEWQAGVECNRLKKILVIKRLTRATQRRKREVKRNMLTLWLKWTTDRNNARRHAFAVQQKRCASHTQTHTHTLSLSLTLSLSSWHGALMLVISDS
jgi:hypothetical protein